MKNRAIYAEAKTAQLEGYFDSVHNESRDQKGCLDSVQVKAHNQERAAKGELPAQIQQLVAKTGLPDKEVGRVLDSVTFGMDVYRREHGVLPTADVIEAAIQQGISAGLGIDHSGRVLDSVGSTGHHDQISAQPNRIVVAITSAIAEAFPGATYLPTDIGSNEARLGIVSHLAGSAFGGYNLSELMDGVNIGKNYLSAERRVALTLAGDRLSATGAVTTLNSGGSSVIVLRGRTIVFVNGYPCAYESPNTAATVANSPISGSINIADTDYAVGGHVVVGTGAISLTFTPALPANTSVEAEAFIDYEANPSLAPELLTQVTTYSLYATPWRALARQTIDSKTQYANELSLDLQSESLIAVRNQFSMERHYSALSKLISIAKNFSTTYNFDWAGQKNDKSRAEIWADFMAILGVVDQEMCERTMDHGITHMYVTDRVMAQLIGLPREIFEPSGITARPGIYRLGRLWGKYEVYFTPRLLNEAESDKSQILCLGRSTQVARCPLVLGDAVAPTYLPLATGSDMRYQQGFYARNFTSVNPHQPSAGGCALINVTNLF